MDQTDSRADANPDGDRRAGGSIYIFTGHVPGDEFLRPGFARAFAKTRRVILTYTATCNSGSREFFEIRIGRAGTIHMLERLRMRPGVDANYSSAV